MDIVEFDGLYIMLAISWVMKVLWINYYSNSLFHTYMEEVYVPKLLCIMNTFSFIRIPPPVINIIIFYTTFSPHNNKITHRATGQYVNK